MTCNKCGCIFEYNVEDIQDSYIKCPTCHKEYYGFEPEYLEKTLFDTGLAECEPTGPLGDLGKLQTLPDEPTYQSLNECEGCPTYKQICSPTGYVGDLPCQWCNKNPWKVTCDTTTYTTSTSNETRGARSWTTCSSTAFTEEDRKITCKAEGVEYTTTLEDYPEMSYDIELPVEPNYYTVNSAAAGGTYSYSEVETYTPDTYSACCSCSCEKASREPERSCEAEAEPTPGKCDCFSKPDKKATKKRKAAK
jgi:hypothetical protein